MSQVTHLVNSHGLGNQLNNVLRRCQVCRFRKEILPLASFNQNFLLSIFGLMLCHVYNAAPTSCVTLGLSLNFCPSLTLPGGQTILQRTPNSNIIDDKWSELILSTMSKNQIMNKRSPKCFILRFKLLFTSACLPTFDR